MKNRSPFVSIHQSIIQYVFLQTTAQNSYPEIHPYIYYNVNSLTYTEQLSTNHRDIHIWCTYNFFPNDFIMEIGNVHVTNQFLFCKIIQKAYAKLKVKM